MPDLDLAALRKVVRAANPHGLSEREVNAMLDAGIREDEYQRFRNTFNLTLALSLLDRIKELEADNRGLQKQIDGWTEGT